MFIVPRFTVLCYFPARDHFALLHDCVLAPFSFRVHFVVVSVDASHPSRFRLFTMFVHCVIMKFVPLLRSFVCST